MAKAAEAGADHGSSSNGAAQQGQSPLQPEDASKHAPCQSALTTAQLRDIELLVVSDSISSLERLHHASHLINERAIRYQRIVTQLLFARRCEECSVLVKTMTQQLMETIPMDGSASRALYEKLLPK